MLIAQISQGVGGLQLKIEDQGLSGVGVEGGIWK